MTMTIKDHIEAGHYPADTHGRALVPTDKRVFVVTATDRPSTHPITGWYQCGGNVDVFTEDGCNGLERLLPPAPRKVKVTARIEFLNGIPHARVLSTSVNGAFGPRHGAILDFVTEYEEPWS